MCPFCILEALDALEYHLIDVNVFCNLGYVTYPYIRPPDKSAYFQTIFLISHPKHMLWVLKRTVSMRLFF